MAIVVPTVLAATPDELAAQLERATSLSQRVHVDISDGQFSDATTIGLAQVNPPEGVAVDLHLMVKDPATELETALSLKPSLLIFHAEAEGDIESAINHCRELGIKAGLALLPETTVDAVAGLIAKSDHVLIFTGHLGHNGGEFRPDQLEKVPALRAIKTDLELSVDGGVNDTNAALIGIQGVDVLYVGGFLQQAEDAQAAYDAISAQAGGGV